MRGMPVLVKMKRATRKTAARRQQRGRQQRGDSNEEDSNKEQSAAKGERAGDESSSDQESGEGSIDEVQEQEEMMTVEQAELMEQYRNDFFSAILVIMRGSG